MSLINDALKKAQRERGETPSVSNAPMPGGGSATAARASAKSGPKPNVLLLGAGTVVGVIIALAAVFWLRPASSSVAPASPAPVASAPRVADSAPSSPPPAATTPAPAPVTPTAAAAEKPVEIVPIVKTEAPVVASTSTPAPAISANEPMSATSSAPAPATTPGVHAGPPAPSARMVEAIEAFRVTGIRASLGSDAKVLMNDRVFRLGDTVDHALGIKLIAATPNSLTFRDTAGATYTRNF